MSLTTYILGGERTTYLPLQLKAINKYIRADEVVYVQGPLHFNRAMASQFRYKDVSNFGIKSLELTAQEVQPSSYKDRIRSTPPAVLPKCKTDYALFLHGDIFPYDEFNIEDILQGKQRAFPQSLSMQWYLTHKDLQENFFVVHRNLLEECTTYVVDQVSQDEWDVLFNGIEDVEQIPYFGAQHYRPSFIHMDNYCNDFEEVVELKAEAISRLYDGLH